jgi:peptidoglycan endopeptidase LytE
VTVVSEAEEAEPEVISVAPVVPTNLGRVEQMMMAAIDARLGIPYRMGSEGPNRYDCSGFVWSVFQTAGVTFERSSARTFWNQFEPVGDADKYKFGTLVFFNGLGHVGIVADANGFYHASSSRGVTYSPFNEYWSKRITGFRRVQLQQPTQTQLAAGR